MALRLSSPVIFHSTPMAVNVGASTTSLPEVVAVWACAGLAQSTASIRTAGKNLMDMRHPSISARSARRTLVPGKAVSRQFLRQPELGVFDAAVHAHQLQNLPAIAQRKHRLAVTVHIDIVIDRRFDQRPQALAAMLVDEHALADAADLIAQHR